MSHQRVNATQGWLTGELERRGVSRREFLNFGATTAAVLALPDVDVGQIAETGEGMGQWLTWLEQLRAAQPCCEVTHHP
jgi:hypothetical protein